MEPKLPLQETTIGGLLRRAAATRADSCAMVHGDKNWSYRELDDDVDRCARRLIAAGVKAGEHVGVWCETEPNLIFAHYALARIGAVACFINTSLPPCDLVEMVRRSDIVHLLIGGGCKNLVYPEIARQLMGEMPSVKSVLYLSELGDAGGFQRLEEVGECDDTRLAEAERAVIPQDTAQILYTSGTTSFPKAVMGSHYSRVNCGIMQAHDMGLTEADRFCMALPLFHCFCLSVNVMAACAVGGCLVLPKSRHTIDLLEALEKERCTVLSGTPAIYRAVMKNPRFHEFDLSPVRIGIIGGCSYSEDLFLGIEREFGMKLISSLGQTEATGGYTVSYVDDTESVRSRTLGHFMDYLEGKIISLKTGEELPAGVEGEICVRGYVVMQGYYGQPEETAKTIDSDGWLLTGDLGVVDEDGNLRLTGRVKDLIIRGGENISPAEIEAVVNSQKGVVSSRAVGVPDEHYGEQVCLCVVPSAKGFDEGALRERLAERLPSYKIPCYILLFDELPVTATGKVQTGKLKEEAVKRLQLEC